MFVRDGYQILNTTVAPQLQGYRPETTGRPAAGREQPGRVRGRSSPDRNVNDDQGLMELHIEAIGESSMRFFELVEKRLDFSAGH